MPINKQFTKHLSQEYENISCIFFVYLSIMHFYKFLISGFIDEAKQALWLKKKHGECFAFLL